MSDKQLTPCIKPRVKPVRPGAYEIRFPDDKFGNDSPGYAFWNGKSWGWASSTPEFAAANETSSLGAIQKKEWRGLAEEPK